MVVSDGKSYFYYLNISNWSVIIQISSMLKIGYLLLKDWNRIAMYSKIAFYYFEKI